MFGSIVPGRGTNEERVPRTVQAALPVDTYLVKYVDQEGRDQVRLAFVDPTSGSVNVLAEKIDRQRVASGATQWFTSGLLNILGVSTKAPTNEEDDLESI